MYTFAPAGGINANVLDMASYVIAHLNQGAFRDKALLKPETARWLHDPTTIITVKGPANVQRGPLAQGPAFYCQGWLRQLLSPTPLVWHNGGTIGSKAVVGFTPDGDLGLVVLSNLDGTDLPEALSDHLYTTSTTLGPRRTMPAPSTPMPRPGKFPVPPAERRQH